MRLRQIDAVLKISATELTNTSAASSLAAEPSSYETRTSTSSSLNRSKPEMLSDSRKNSLQKLSMEVKASPTSEPQSPRVGSAGGNLGTIRIHYEDGSFKTLAISSTTNALVVIKLALARLQIEEDIRTYELVLLEEGKEDEERLIQDEEHPFEIQESVAGPSSNFRFVLRKIGKKRKDKHRRSLTTPPRFLQFIKPSSFGDSSSWSSLKKPEYVSGTSTEDPRIDDIPETASTPPLFRVRGNSFSLRPPGTTGRIRRNTIHAEQPQIHQFPPQTSEVFKATHIRDVPHRPLAILAVERLQKLLNLEVRPEIPKWHHSIRNISGSTISIASASSPRLGGSWGRRMSLNRFAMESDKDLRVFGVPLEKQMEREWSKSRATRIPEIASICLNYINANGLSTPGLFRVSGSSRRIKLLREEFDMQRQPNMQEVSPHDVAGLFKAYLRELPEPLLTSKLYELFISSARELSGEMFLYSLRLLMCLLPTCNRELLEHLIELLNNVSKHAESGGLMDATNLAICIGPNVLYQTIREKELEASQFVIQVAKVMIETGPQLFEVPSDLVAAVNLKLREKKNLSDMDFAFYDDPSRLLSPPGPS